VERARAQDPRAEDFLAGAAAWAWLPSLAAKPAGGGAGSGMTLPLGSAWFAARRDGAEYELSGLAALAVEVNPRVLAGAVRLAAAALLRKAGLPDVVGRLRAMEVEVVADSIAVRGLRLSEAEVLSAAKALFGPRTGEAANAAGGD
jgi:hypothetical protein